VTSDWKRSSGTKKEIEWAFFYGVPVFYAIGSLRTWLATPDHEIQVVSPVTKRRLRALAEGLSLPPPANEDERQRQLQIVADALRATQSLDDLTCLSPTANLKIAAYQDDLLTRHERLSVPPPAALV
jgi:hypothetical protein